MHRCDICVNVCPTNVFAAVPGAPPVIARQEDCQTCFMCELYCPEDALFVAPEAELVTPVEEQVVHAKGLLGSYREVGWAVPSGAVGDQSFRLTAPR